MNSTFRRRLVQTLEADLTQQRLLQPGVFGELHLLLFQKKVEVGRVHAMGEVVERVHSLGLEDLLEIVVSARFRVPESQAFQVDSVRLHKLPFAGKSLQVVVFVSGISRVEHEQGVEVGVVVFEGRLEGDLGHVEDGLSLHESREGLVDFGEEEALAEGAGLGV